MDQMSRHAAARIKSPALLLAGGTVGACPLEQHGDPGDGRVIPFAGCITSREEHVNSRTGRHTAIWDRSEGTAASVDDARSGNDPRRIGRARL